MPTGPTKPLQRSVLENVGAARGTWRAAERGPRGRTLAQTVARLRAPGPWLVWDALAAAGAAFAAHALSPVFESSPLGEAARRVALIFAAAFVLAALGAGFYDRTVWRARRLIVLRAAAAALLAAVGTLAFHYLAFYAPIGRRVSAAAFVLTLAFSTAPRLLLWEALRRRPRRLLFVGDDALQAHTHSLLDADSNHNYEVVGVLRAGPRADLVEVCHAEGVDEVLLPLRTEEMQPVLGPALACLPLGCRVRSVADFYEDVFRTVPVRHVSAAWLLARGWDSSDHVAEAWKRASDVLLALVLLVLSAPLLLAAVVAQRVTDRGPVFYAQTRVGRYGRPFRMLKLRSMHVDAEPDGPSFTAPGDPRRTRLGALLRRTRLDELPQLVNVLRGEMSFVGPRPERPEFVAELERALPLYGWRHLVRPGLTGWAQINYPYGAGLADAERKLEYDLYYLRHLSPLTDLGIVLRTASEAMKGAR